MTLHPAVAPVRAVLGTWRGEGRGEYPTITPFDYTEELTFTDVGKPFVHYQQKTWAATDGRPLHTETGYLRVIDGATVEFVLAQPTGHTELAEGSLNATHHGLTLSLTSRVVNSASAKRVDETARRYELAGDTLTTAFAMAAVGVPLTHHLASTLRRIA